MNGVVITSVGALSALGQGSAALLDGIEGRARPAVVSKKIRTRSGEKEILAYVAPEVALSPEIPESVKRRMPRISKMYFATVCEAVEGAFGSRENFKARDPQRTGLVVGTALGCLGPANQYQRRVILEGPSGASPSLFASSIQNAIASHLSISFNVQGPTATVTTMEGTTVGALSLARDWLRQEIVDQVVVTVGDEMSEYQPYALAHLEGEPSRRLDPRSDECTAIAGEGIACFVLERDIGQKRLCRITGLELYSTDCPPASRVLAAAYGARGQWSRYRAWTKREDWVSHAQLFGSSPTGSALEVAIGALLVARDGRDTACVQLTDRGEAQTIRLGR